MNNKIKSEKFRKLSKASLVTGILAIIISPPFFFIFAMEITFNGGFFINSRFVSLPVYILLIVIEIVIMFALPVATTVCGSIDLKRIKAGSISNKGKGFDIAGMVMGGIFIFIFLVALIEWATAAASAAIQEYKKEIVPLGADGISPSWSPDGKKIAFNSNRDGNWEIYVMNADGSGETNLTNNFPRDFSPSWSPDGKKIAFESDRYGGNYDIYVMDADGSREVRMTNNPAGDGSPSWSPDGKKIAFNSNRDGNWEIYVMNGDGQE